MRHAGLVLLGGLIAALPALAADTYPIAGVTPDQRPTGAPVLKEVVRPKDWDRAFYHGITEPYPASLRWKADQGAWFTPFDRPGMPPPYDLRGWHASKGAPK